MKTKALIMILSILPATGFAKISDFNAMISENMKQQSELHGSVKNNVAEARDSVESEGVRKRMVVVDDSKSSYNSPTQKELLAFSKEKKRNTLHEEKKQFGRLATEINLSDE